MKLYHSIRTMIYIAGFLAVGICYYLSSENTLDIQRKNVEADQLFLKWFLNSDKASERLKGLIDNDAEIEYIAKVSQLPLKKLSNSNEIDQKIDYTLNKYFEKYEAKKSNINEFRLISRQLIKPEFDVFLNFENPVYDQFINSLKKYKTPAKTSLREWALRYLTSESVIVGLPMISKLKEDDKQFYNLPISDQEEILQKISLIVSNQFFDNLNALKKKYKFKIDDRLYQIIQNKIYHFLKAKFVF